MKTRLRRGLSSQLLTLAVAAILLSTFTAYQYVQVTNLQAQVTSLKNQLHVLEFPCAEKPLKVSEQDKVYPNGTAVVNISYPVFALSPGSFGTLCVSYTNDSNNSSWSGFGYSAFDWKNSSIHPAGVSVVESPRNLTIPPGQSATVIYMFEASDSSAGYYGLNLDHDCGSYQLIVSRDPSASNISDFPGLLTPDFTGCLAWQPPGTILGFNGLNMVYLRNTTRFAIGYNETSRSVVSTVKSPTEQNITFTVGIQSFSFPITVWFATGQSTFSDFRKFKSNPEVTPIPGNVCDWIISNETAYSDGNWEEIPLPMQGITINAPTLHVPPFSHATFTFSMLIANLTRGYYVTFLGFVISWKNSPGEAPDLGTYFPISVGSGQWSQDLSGTCPVQ